MSAADPQAIPIDVALAQAILHHQAGRLAEAEQLYRAILKAFPDHPEATHNLGVLALQAGQPTAGLPFLRAALEANPHQSQYWLSYIDALVQAGQTPTARQVLMQGRQRGLQGAEADELARRLEAKPGSAEDYSRQGVAFGLRGQLDEAAANFRRALEIKPDFAEAHCNLGAVLKNLGQLDEAVACYRRALALKPDYAMAYNNLSNALNDLGQLDEAVAHCRRALEINPDFAEAHSNLGNALKNLGQLDAAVACYRRALEIKPDLAEVISNLGNALNDLGHLEEALAHCRRALAINPDLAEAHSNLGNTLKNLGQLDDAVASYRRALEIKPGFAMAHSNLIFALDLASGMGTDIATLQQERRHWDALHAQPLAAMQRPHANPPDPERRLRIGYVSADFWWHSAAKVFGAMLLKFDPAGFEVFVYSNGMREDAQTRLFQQGVTGWRRIVGQSDEAVAELIRQDGIDILVDLSGHSAGNRLRVFARKPAPIQITAWGYATSTGMQAMDFFFADPVVVPPEEKHFFTEEVRYLPNVVCSYFPEAFPAVNALPALSDPASAGITFGSFNRLSKVSDAAFATWAQVLLAVPQSRLVFKANELDDPATRDRVIRHFTDAGVDAERIVLLGNTSWDAHVATFNQIDMALDPFPHGGGVSTLEGLMMGVPVVTLRWPSIAGRLTASILTTVGLTDWIAETPEQYVEIAIQKARDLPTPATLRKNLRGIFAASIIGDSPAYVKTVEQEYRTLWREWCQRSSPLSHEPPSQLSCPSDQEINTLMTLFAERRYAEATPLAQSMTERFPLQGFGWKALGAAFSHMGHDADALATLQKAAVLVPDDAEVHSNLGIVLRDLGQLDDAVASCRRAVELKPDFAEAHSNLGNALKDLGQLDAAVASFHRALEIAPNYAEAHFNLGNALNDLGQLDDAGASYRRAITLNPDYAGAHSNLGVVLQALGQPHEAITSYRRALALQPDFAEAHYNLGNVLHSLGQSDDALTSFHRALALKPDYAEAHSNLGLTLINLGQFDDAVASCRRALEIKPDYAEAHSNLGVVLQNQGQHDVAVASYRHALEFKPDYAEAHYNLGVALQALRQLDDAVACYRRSLEINPDYAEAHSNLGVAMEELGQLDEAMESYRRALALKPDFANAHSNLIFALDLKEDVDTQTLLAERRRWGEAFGFELQGNPPFANRPDPARRLRVGYVSADFREHSAAIAFGAMLTQFDPAAFDVFAYSNSTREDDHTRLFQQRVTGWRNITRLSDAAVADLIRQDAIDILVDLSGHSGNNRLRVFARKPAPIQITAWGYAGGTGMKAMDYLFSDAVVVPPEEKPHYVEEVRYLPCVISAFFPVPFPPVNDLPASAVNMTFGSLNRVAKISDAAFKAWTRILLAVPLSRILLKTPELDDTGMRERITGRFIAAGIDPARIILQGRTSWHEHMAAFNRIDIALDPFPQSGGITTLEGLMMGVPVITLRGKTFVGRGSASLLQALAMDDWIAATPDQYVEIAVRQARDLTALAELRQQLRPRFMASIIGDTAAYARVVEQEYRTLWREWCQRSSLLPDPQEINTLATLFAEGRYTEAAPLAQSMTERFPLHGFGWKALGSVFKQTGRNADALAPMQKAAALAPEDAEAHSNLAVVLKDLGQLADAAASCRRAIALKPNHAEAHYNLGNALSVSGLGQRDDAVASYRRAIALNPNYTEAHYNLGTMLSDLGQTADAVASYQRAIALNPNYAEAHYNLGNALNELGQPDDAVACFRRVLAIKPDHAEAHLNLGNAMYERGQLDDAVAIYRQALQVKPDFAEAHCNLGLALKNLGKLDEAVASCQQALAIKADYADAYSNLGVALKDLGQLDDAMASYRRALEIMPDFPEALSNLGNALKDLGRLDEAVASYRRALEVKPDYAEAHSNLGSVMKDLGRFDEALASFRRALAIKPDFANAHSNLIFALDLKEDVDTQTLLAERRRWGEAFASGLDDNPAHANHPDPARRLRVGYVSADFREHSASIAFGAMLTQFDPAQFEVFAYSNSTIEDEHTRLFRQGVTGWRKIVGLSDAAVAELVRQDAIDILVDLSGHSCGSRLRVFARKPAPIQITAWGYAGGTGMKAMDYLFSDAVVVPPEEKPYYAEEVRYLPSVISAFYPATFPPVNALPASVATVTFGSLNRLTKVSDAAFKAWTEILSATPQSRILLKAPELEDSGIRERITGRFLKAGIDPARITLLGQTSWHEHMATFNQIDISLDPFPQSGGITTLEGLMMGVPVVTLRGSTFVGRGSASLLTTLGMTGWIAETREQYVDIAVRQAQDLPALAELRQQLRPRFMTSIIGDTAAYARIVEQEYRTLWQEWCTKRNPL